MFTQGAPNALDFTHKKRAEAIRSIIGRKPRTATGSKICTKVEHLFRMLRVWVAENARKHQKSRPDVPVSSENTFKYAVQTEVNALIRPSLNLPFPTSRSFLGLSGCDSPSAYHNLRASAHYRQPEWPDWCNT